MSVEDTEGMVFDIQRFSLHDGPGIRTLVFLKGCPLRCQWCANPESVSPRPELGFTKVRCTKCGKCVALCHAQAIIIVDGDGVPRIDRQRCTNCGDCAKACFDKALTVWGKEMTAEEALEEVKRDQMFYDSSGGGVTASGGEPLQQYVFVRDLFRLCRRAGIHTALETCGFASKRVWEEVLPLTNYVLFDLKHLDSESHRRFTGKPNRLILENARFVARSGTPVLFRSPLIPGVNDTPENVRDTATFLREIQGEEAAIELMPYHRLGIPKYQALDRPYFLEGKGSAELAYAESVGRSYEDFGVRCSVSR